MRSRVVDYCKPFPPPLPPLKGGGGVLFFSSVFKGGLDNEWGFY